MYPRTISVTVGPEGFVRVAGPGEFVLQIDWRLAKDAAELLGGVFRRSAERAMQMAVQQQYTAWLNFEVLP